MSISIKSPTSTTGSIQKNGSDVLTIDSSDNVTVVNNLSVTGTLSQGGSVVQSPWTTTGSNIYYTTGSVGIGTSSPDKIFHVQSSDASSLTNRTDLVGVFEKSGGASISIATDSTSSSSILFADNGDADGCEIEYDHTVNDLIFKVGGNVERARIEDSGNLKFNSGYGSVATAYGVRAWVNFNGTGTVAILASGNVSSLTDNGVGDYTISFTNAMPDTNYVMTGNYDYVYNSTQYFDQQTVPRTFATGSLRINQGHAATNYNDAERVMVSIIR